MRLKNLIRNKNGDMNLILSAVVIGIVLAISIIIIFNVMVSIDTSDLNTKVAIARGSNTSLDRTATNATDDLMTNLETFYTVSPIVLIVIAAIGILSYVLLLRRK